MSRPPIIVPRPTNANEAQSLLDAISAAGSGRKYADSLGIDKGHVNRQAHVARSILAREEMTGGNAELPDFGDDDIPVEDIIATMKKRNKKRIDHAESKKWFSIKMKDNKPIGIVFFGDPHLDDDCCNWELLESHIKLVSSHKRIFGINIGDSHNNWAGKLMRIYAEQETSRRTAYKLVKWFLFESGIKWLVWLLGNHDCLDRETECLTDTGWRTYKELRKTDKVLSIDPSTGTSVWSPINEIIILKSNGFINQAKTRCIDMAVTDKHRVMYHSKTGGRLGAIEYAKISDIPASVAIPLSAPSKKEGAIISDDAIEYAAWILTDGFIDEYTGYHSIYQSKKSDIGNLLSRLGLEYSVYERQRNQTVICGKSLRSCLPDKTFAITAGSRVAASAIIDRKDRLPKWCECLSTRQVVHFVECLIKGDGSWASMSDRSAVLYGQKPFLDKVQALCVEHGISANISCFRSNDWRLNICFGRLHHRIDNLSKKALRVTYSGDVWCLSVPHTNFMVRRNGKSYFTGNSWADGIDRMKAMGANAVVMEDWRVQFKLVFPNGTEVLVDAAHDHKGSSEWNELHAQLKVARTERTPHIVVAGHRHTPGLAERYNPHDPAIHKTWLCRLNSYKWKDSHAWQGGFYNHNGPPAMMAVIDPSKPNDPVFMTGDLERGVRELGYLLK